MVALSINKALLAIATIVGVVCAVTKDFDDKLVANEIEIDAKWVDKDAHHKLDIVIVLDESGSVGLDNFQRAKQWIRSFLDFFSISNQYTQVGLVTFASEAKIQIPLNRGKNKCEFLSFLDQIPYKGGATNIGAGLSQAEILLATTGRPDVPRKLVLLISDGWSTEGTLPATEQRKILKRYPKSYFMVLAIGLANDFKTQLSSLATKDVKGNRMIFGIKDFKNFAHVAFYFHKGEQGSQLFPVDSSNCKKPSCDTKSKAFCACDSLGRGAFQCGCEAGYFAATNKKSRQDQCQACPLGEYIDKKSARRTCKICGGTKQYDRDTQTTGRTGSVSAVECVCETGFVNSANQRTKQPPCSRIRCPVMTQQQRANLNLALSGVCHNTYKSRCSFKCLYGHAPAQAEHMNLECKSTGQWTHAIPQCVAVLCPTLTTVANAVPWKCTAARGLRMYQHGTQCVTKCNVGYQIKPDTSPFRICTANRTWSGRNLECIARTCSSLPTIPNGGYKLPQCNLVGSVRPFGMMCEVQCNLGFKLRVGGKAKYTCTTEGHWDNSNLQPECLDIRPPAITDCSSAKHQYLDSEEGMSFARFKLVIPTATDNSRQKPTLQVSIKTLTETLTEVDYSKVFQFPIGNSIVTYTFSDGVGNKAHCSLAVTVKDIEAPRVISCDGPATNDSYIFTQDSDVYVTWPEPVFSDNSGKKPSLFPTSRPGQFGIATHKITYTATDDASNRVTCSFEFTVIGQPCPPLHVPQNGALACDKMSFGTVCAPHCRRGLAPLYPDHIRTVREYFCTLQGRWRPSHAYVADCSIRTPWEDEFVLNFDGDCDDEETREQIKKNTFESLQSSFAGQELIRTSGLTYDRIHVQCGAKNDSIIRDGSRRKRSINSIVDNSDSDLPKTLSRSKRDLTATQLLALEKLLGRKISVSKTCPAGMQLKTDTRGRKTCYKCPPGSFWSGATRKCVRCPIGTYSLTDGKIDKCTPCGAGTTTADTGAGNKTLCVEQCNVGHYSRNGLMSPVNCRACAKGTYADTIALKQCTACPSRTTTSDSGAKDRSSCQAQCPPGYSSHNGLAPCDKCPLNTYQPRTGQTSCLKCRIGQSTLARGSTQLSQCFVVNECKSNPCRNGATCIDGVNKFICKCTDGWSGVSCQVNVDECASKPCWSGATCVDLLNDFRCDCPPGFKGKVCNQDINDCQTNPCANGGQCIDLKGSFECSCQAGYGGKTCRVNQDDCSPGICKNGGTCKDLLNGFICQCARGFRGEQCTENIDDCISNTCQNGATCVDGVNTYTCRCVAGYTGSRCQTNINECARRPCRNGGICTDAINDYICTCANNWGGKDCTTKLTDCFNLDMNSNSIEDYVVYDPATKIPTMSEITVKYSMRSNDKGLQAHYGTIISYGLPGKEGLFNIRAFPEQMLQVNSEDWLTGVDATNDRWNTVCMTWRASDGRWKAYTGAGTTLRLVSNDAQQAISRSRPIQGGGRFVIGQLYQGQDTEFSESNIYQGQLYGLTIWYKYDQCTLGTSPNIAWPNLVFNGKVVTRTNANMVRKGLKRETRC